MLLLAQVVTPVSTGAKPMQTPTHTIAAARVLPNGTTGVIVQGAISVPAGVHASGELWMQDDTAGN